MKIKEVTYGRTSTKNFQSKRAEVVVTLEEGDTYGDAIAKARMIVSFALDESPTEADVAKAREVLDLAAGYQGVRR